MNNAVSATTPGPWCFEPDFREIISGDGLTSIALVANGDYHSVVRVPTEAECEANGRLLAAAPSLLYTLRQIVEHVTNGGEGCRCGDGVRWMASLAIDNAQGGVATLIARKP